MTGLNPEVDVIIEIATIVTDSDLNVLAEGPALAVQQSEGVLGVMDDWNFEHHTKSGLLDRVRTEGVLMKEAEARTLAFIEQYTDRSQSPLCGNSIWQDRRFLARYMPDLEAFLHYRIIDVSTLKELVKRWQPDLLTGFEKKGEHLALADIRESIDELRLYRDRLFRR